MAQALSRLLRVLAVPALLAISAMPAHAQTALQTGQSLLSAANGPQVEPTGEAVTPTAGTPATVPPAAAPAAGTPAAVTPAPAGTAAATVAPDPSAGHIIKATDPTKPAIDVPGAEKALGSLDEPFLQSFFLTPLDLVALQRAVAGQVSAVGPGGAANQEIPQVRKITLSGVAYKNAGDWIVWINGHKIAPGNTMSEIIDIKVERDLVHLKWFDIGLNGIINITLRPHETYDIVTGVLLPGGP